MKRILCIITLVVGLCSSLFSQELYKNEPAFIGGEDAFYNVYYNLGFIWIHAGNVRFSVTEKVEDGKPVYLLKLVGYTIKSFDHLYTIRDTFSVTVSKDELLPRNYREVKHEDSYFSDRRYHFDHEFSSKVYWTFNRKGKLSNDSIEIDKSVFDLLTTCYRFRSLDMEKIHVGDLVPFNMLFDKTIYNLKLTYRGTEDIKLRNKTRYNALKFVPKLITGDLFKREDDMKIYVSNDDNHIPLYIEAKIKVGSVKVMLSEVKNTKYPLSSELKK